MADRLFLYIDILGFKELVKSGGGIAMLYKTIDELNVHRDRDFTCIVFSDTILVYADEMWLGAPNQGDYVANRVRSRPFLQAHPKGHPFSSLCDVGKFRAL